MKMTVYRLCGLLFTGCMALSHGSLRAQEIPEELEAITVSGSVALVSDYRFRGVSLSDEDFALQGSINLSTESGFYLGTWGSSIESFNGAETEIDVYGGYIFDLSGTQIDVGATGFIFPGGSDTHYVEPYVRATRAFGNLSLTLGAAYAPDQENIGGEDNIYLSSDARLPLTEIAGLPLALTGHLGWEDGAFGDDKADWSLGLTTSWESLTFGLSYTDTNTSGDATDATLLVTIGASF